FRRPFGSPRCPPAARVANNDDDDDAIAAKNAKPVYMFGNEWWRRAVRQAVCNNDTFDLLEVLAIAGDGSNGVVVSARLHVHDAPAGVLLAIKIIYKSKGASSFSTTATGDVIRKANDPWPHEVLLHRRSQAHFHGERHFYRHGPRRR
ncbi:hypothetical protein HK405_008663, partial [Cladochytrium tenue]